MKHFLPRLLLLSALTALLTGCGTPNSVFIGLTATLVKVERTGDGQVEATVKFSNPNLAIYNISKSVHRISLDGAAAGTLTLDQPFGLSFQTSVEKTGKLTLEGAGAEALSSAIARGTAAYRMESTLTILLYGEDKQTLKTSSSGSVAAK